MLLAERGEALEADLQRYYGLDLADMWRGKITPRKVAVLAIHLPPGAAIRRTGPDDLHWSHESQVLVSLFDQIRHLSWGLAGGQGRPPQPQERPGDSVREAPKRSRAARLANRWLNRSR